ncbi:wax ester/triacylglycerol synthase domain-containing protein [Zhongshania guokunii]|uniref:diacylglycerol O-acyltransferase n=1 Tax=Zhongshania guokunii TaxID=641783 RepID=A0ABV3U3S6_9GAMM
MEEVQEAITADEVQTAAPDSKSEPISNPVKMPRRVTKARVNKAPVNKAASAKAAHQQAEPCSPERLQALRSWGGDKVMSAAEAIMWRMEVLPKTRSTGTSVHMLDGCPDWQRFLDTMTWMVSSVPRLRQRVFETGIPGQLPCWVNDDTFSLHYHVRRVSLPAPGGYRELMDFLETFATTPCDRSRPPWEIVLIEGCAENRSAFAMKIHHSLTDGGGLIQLFNSVLARDPNEYFGGDATWPAATSPWSRNFAARLIGDAKQFSGGVSSLGRQGLAWLRSGNTELSRIALDYSRSLLALTQAQSGGGSPLFRKRSLATRFELLDVSFAPLKAAAKAAGVSFNDVYLAGIIGGFRRYHEAYDMTLEAVPLSFPVSVRKPGDPAGGNRFSGVSYRAPVHNDLAQQLKEVSEFVSQVRKEPAIDFFNQIMPSLLAMPSSVVAALMSVVTSRMDAQASNIPGMRDTVYLAGSKVLAHYVLPPRPGCAVMYAMITHGDTACLALNIDPAAIKEPQLLLDSVTAEFNDIIRQYAAD